MLIIRKWLVFAAAIVVAMATNAASSTSSSMATLEADFEHRGAMKDHSYAVYDAADLFASATSSRSPLRPSRRSGCALFVDQRAARGGGAAGGKFDQIVSLPLTDMRLTGTGDDVAYNVHVNVHARFVARGANAPEALVGSDLLVGLSDGTRMIGFLRTSPFEQSRAKVHHWGTPVAAQASAKKEALQLSSIETIERAAGGICSGSDKQKCASEAGEQFELLFHLTNATSTLVASPALNFRETHGAVGHTFASSPSQSQQHALSIAAGTELSLVFYAAEADHAYEISLVEVRTQRVAGARPLSEERNKNLETYISTVSSHVASSLFSGAALAAGAAASTLTALREHTLTEDGCGLAFAPSSIADADVAFAKLLSIPLVKKKTFRANDHIAVRITIEATSQSPRNNLLVAVADQSHLIGFERGDGVARSFGWAFGGALEAYAAAGGKHEAVVRNGRFAEVESGGAAAHTATRFQVTILLGNNVARVLATPTGGAVEMAAAADTLLSSAKATAAYPYALDLTRDLQLVLLQNVEDAEASTVRLLAASVHRVRLGCDSVADSDVAVDRCGVCGGDDECVGCDGRPNSGAVFDQCQVCGGDGTSCVDCHGTVRGTAVVDECGVCGGNNDCLLLAGKSASGAAEYRKRHAEKYGQEATDASAVAPEHEAVAALREKRLQALRQAGEGDGGGQVGVDCAGNLIRPDRVPSVVDECGVCGGNNECLGCDGKPGDAEVDVCGVCNGDGTTCCHNYLDVTNEYWNFLLLPVTIDNVIDGLQCTYDALAWLAANFPAAETLDADDINELQVGRMAEFYRIFTADCLEPYCQRSGEVRRALVVDNAHKLH